MSDIRYKFTLLYIYGSGRCGSTILDMMLNAHPQIIGLGEVVGLHSVLAPKWASQYVPSGHREKFIRFWRSINTDFKKETGVSFNDVTFYSPLCVNKIVTKSKTINKQAELNWKLFEVIAKVSGASVLTDASKLPGRLHLLLQSNRQNIKVIHLIRDGRAVVASYAHKHGSFRYGLWLWIITIIMSYYFKFRLGSNFERVKYEDLILAPKTVLGRICSFLGLEFDPVMMNFPDALYYGAGGNRDVRKNTTNLYTIPKSYKLTLWQRLCFLIMGGWLNALLGYGAW